MNGYLVASQLIRCKYICPHIRKRYKSPCSLFPFASRMLPPSCSGLCQRAHCSPATGELGQLLSSEKAAFHLSLLLSSRPDALQNKQTTYLHIIAKTAYQATFTESLTVWSCEIQQTLAGLPMSLLLDLCFQMETI